MEIGSSMEAVKEAVNIVEEYKATEKPPRSDEKLSIQALLNSLQL